MPYSNINALIAAGQPAPEWNFIDSRKRAADLIQAERQLADYGENQNVLRALRRQQVRKGEIEIEGAERSAELSRELQPMKTEREILQYLRDVGSMIKWNNYPQSREWMITRNKINPSLLPEPQEFIDRANQQGVTPDELFEQYKRESLTTIDQQLKAEMADERLKSAETIAQTRAESAERINEARLQGAEKLTESRLESMEKRQQQREAHLKELTEVKQNFKEQLDAVKQEEKKAKDLFTRQKEARLSIFKLYGMNEFSRVDESTSAKAGAALELAAKALAEDPELSPAEAANMAKNSVDGRFDILEKIPLRKKAGLFGKSNLPETHNAIKQALSAGVDTGAILSVMIEKGYTRDEAIKEIRNAAGIK